MNAPLTMGQMFDYARHELGKSTALEAGMAIGDPDHFGGIGFPHPNQPAPSNPLLEQMVRWAVSDINIKAKLGGNDAPMTLAVPAQTANGPFRVDLQTAFIPRQSQVNEVTRVWWNTNPPLRWTSGQDMDAFRSDYMQQPPGIPEWCWIQNYNLFIGPAPASPGTLFVYAAKALLFPNGMDSTIEQLPSDLNWVVPVGAAWRICATQPDDQVEAAREPLLRALYQDGINQIKTTKGAMGQNAPHLIAIPYRSRRGSR